LKTVSFTDGQSGGDWLTWRKHGIGASDIAVIMRSNTYRTVLSLWDEKYQTEPAERAPLNAAMRHGIEHEESARTWVNSDQNLNLVPLCLEDVENSHFRASLDGYDSEKRVLCEIKCPVSEYILDKAIEHGDLPKYWLHQIQWQIMICKPIRAFIAVWDYRCSSCVLIECYAEPELQEKMRKKAHDFWRTIEIGASPDPCSKDFILIEDDGLKKLLLEYAQNTKEINFAYEKRKPLRDKIEIYGEGQNFKCEGYSVMRYRPNIRYDIAQMKEDGINVEKYIKKPSGNGYFKIFCPKDSDE